MLSRTYKRKINDLIPRANEESIRQANALENKFEIRNGIGGGTYRHCFRSEFFHKIMNRLAFEAGLRSWF
jgi:hypothetical protein